VKENKIPLDRHPICSAAFIEWHHSYIHIFSSSGRHQQKGISLSKIVSLSNFSPFRNRRLILIQMIHRPLSDTLSTLHYKFMEKFIFKIKTPEHGVQNKSV